MVELIRLRISLMFWQLVEFTLRSFALYLFNLRRRPGIFAVVALVLFAVPKPEPYIPMDQGILPEVKARLFLSQKSDRLSDLFKSEFLAKSKEHSVGSGDRP